MVRLEEEDIYPKTDMISPQPFLKWAGGKRSILGEISPRIPAFKGRYIEPFLGAGAVFFSLDAAVPKVLNDFNVDLIEVYEVIRDELPALLSELSKHKNDKEHFLSVRSMDRRDNFGNLSPAVRAARFIYLNKTCFNGLYRVNRNGHFNVPFGKQANPDFIAESNLRAVSRYLNTVSSDGSLPQFLSGDYRETTAIAVPGDFVYLDPPYDPVSTSSSFVSYQRTGFNREDQEQLRDEVLRLTKLNVPVLLSNSDTEFIRTIYADRNFFETLKIQARRAISASSAGRGTVSEVLVSNHPGLRRA